MHLRSRCTLLQTCHGMRGRPYQTDGSGGDTRCSASKGTHPNHGAPGKIDKSIASQWQMEAHSTCQSASLFVFPIVCFTISAFLSHFPLEFQLEVSFRLHFSYDFILLPWGRDCLLEQPQRATEDPSSSLTERLTQPSI
jgi:hypothetical protein